MTEVVVAERLSKSHGRVQALAGISLRLEAGSFVGVLGPNGAGKTTLFQICAGLMAPDGGEIRLFGATYRSRRQAILRRLGVVFQARSLDHDLAVRTNLRLHGNLFGLAGPGLQDAIAEAAAIMEIADLLDRPVRQLSGGNQRRVEIARALLHGPELLLLDEPTAGLDPESRRRLLIHLRDVCRRRGTAVLWATHLVGELESADRIMVLARGRVLADAPPAALLKRSRQSDLAAAARHLLASSEARPKG